MSSDLAWESLRQSLPVGAMLRGIVTRHLPFGIFVDIDGIPFTGLVQITDFKDSGKMTVEEYPPVGSVIVGIVLGFMDSGKQIWLGMKPSQLRQGHENTDAVDRQ